jgi:hypothetical protein
MKSARVLEVRGHGFRMGSACVPDVLDLTNIEDGAPAGRAVEVLVDRGRVFGDEAVAHSSVTLVVDEGDRLQQGI